MTVRVDHKLVGSTRVERQRALRPRTSKRIHRHDQRHSRRILRRLKRLDIVDI